MTSTSEPSGAACLAPEPVIDSIHLQKPTRTRLAEFGFCNNQGIAVADHVAVDVRKKSLALIERNEGKLQLNDVDLR